MGSMRNDDTNIFNVAEYDEAFWNSYLEARPKYSRGGFYDKIFAYHDKHSGRYHVAHDIGTGPGQVTAVLSDRFEQVVASDLNQTHLDVCNHRNAAKSRNITSLLCSGEDISSKVDAGSADAIFCAEALALMDPEKAIEAFARILKPNGVLAVWYYGRPMLSDSKCTEIYDKIVNTLFRRIIESLGPIKTEQWKKTADIMASWLDSVRFDESLWKDVERYKWNTDGEMTFHDEDAGDFSRDISSAIREKEMVMQMPDKTMWAESWNVEDIRRFVEVNLPAFAAQSLFDDPAIDDFFGELEHAMGGKAAKQEITWPVVLLLATKK